MQLRLSFTKSALFVRYQLKQRYFPWKFKQNSDSLDAFDPCNQDNYYQISDNNSYHQPRGILADSNRKVHTPTQMTSRNNISSRFDGSDFTDKYDKNMLSPGIGAWINNRERRLSKSEIKDVNQDEHNKAGDIYLNSQKKDDFKMSMHGFNLRQSMFMADNDLTKAKCVNLNNGDREDQSDIFEDPNGRILVGHRLF